MPAQPMLAALKWAGGTKSTDIVCAHQTGVGYKQQSEKPSHSHNKAKHEGTWTLHKKARQTNMFCIPQSAIKAPDKEQSNFGPIESAGSSSWVSDKAIPTELTYPG